MNRIRISALALIVSLALAGCTAGPDVASTSGPSAPEATPSETPTPTALTEDELQLRALTIDEFPIPGYVAMPNGSDGSGTEESGVCQLNLTSVVTGDDSSDVDFPYVQSTFERASTNDNVNLGVAAAPDPLGLVADIEATLAACPSSSSTDDVAVTLEPLLEGDVDFDVPDSSCRTFQMTFAAGSAGGSFCIVAVDDVVVTVLGATTPMWSYRSADEFATITMAAVEKAAP